jgi:hypothetical protein
MRLVAMAILVLGSGSPLVGADPIAYFSGTLSSGESGLLRMDLGDGGVAEIGPFGPDGVGTNALAFAPDGTLYGIAVDGEGGGRLVTVDPATGAATPITELTFTDPFNYLGSMTADACGRLFVGGFTEVAGGELRDKVFALDPTTGTILEIASDAWGFGPSGLAASGETLFTVHQGVLSILDPVTGDITPIGGASVPAFDVDFAADGFLWGAVGAAPIPVPDPTGSTHRIDSETGEVEVVAQHGRTSMYGGIAIAPPPGVCGPTPVAIPSASPLGLAALAALLAAGGMTLAGRETARRPYAG